MRPHFEQKFLLLDPRQAYRQAPKGKYLVAASKPAVWSIDKSRATAFTRQEIDLMTAHWPYLAGCKPLPHELEAV